MTDNTDITPDQSSNLEEVLQIICDFCQHDVIRGTRPYTDYQVAEDVMYKLEGKPVTPVVEKIMDFCQDILDNALWYSPDEAAQQLIRILGNYSIRPRSVDVV